MVIHPRDEATADAAQAAGLSPADLQKRYRERRRRWAWKIGRPYSEDLHEPDPGVIDAVDPFEG